MLSSKSSSRGKLLDKYVRVRITRMDTVDIGLFERDWNNTLYYFIMNADEQIYMRYGGRDARGPMTYLNLDSLELALAKGLELHEQYQKGELKKTPKPQPRFPREIPPLVERTFGRGACVECHLIGDFDLLYKEQTGKLDRMSQMFRWPDVRMLGIQLDVPKGLIAKEAKAPIQPGDRIAEINKTPVWTFGDLQYYFDKTPRTAKQVEVAVDRAGKLMTFNIDLPNLWWVTDLRFRQLSVDPRAEFETRPLTADEKRKLELPIEGFASEVTRIGGFAQMLKVHELKVGDIVYAVDGIQRDDVAATPDLYIKLHKTAGDEVSLDIIREGKRMKMPVRTQRMYFRK